MANPRMSISVVVAFAITGLLIGFVTGLSHTPVVRGLLPLLFGVIGGGAGFFAVTKVEDSGPIGMALAALSMIALVGVMEGIVVRDGITWRELFAGRAEITLPASMKGSAQRYTRVLAIKLRMQRLDANPQEIRDLMEAVATAKDEDLVQVETTVLSLERSVLPATTVDISRGLASEDQESIRRKEKELGIPQKGISSIRPNALGTPSSGHIYSHGTGQ